jgi:hypothetical protein
LGSLWRWTGRGGRWRKKVTGGIAKGGTWTLLCPLDPTGCWGPQGRAVKLESGCTLQWVGLCAGVYQDVQPVVQSSQGLVLGFHFFCAGHEVIT